MRHFQTAALVLVTTAVTGWALHLVLRESSPPTSSAARLIPPAEGRSSSVRANRPVVRPNRPALPRRSHVARESEEDKPNQTAQERREATIAFENSEERSFIDDFERESVDADWAARWESTLDTQVQQFLGELPGFDSASVECRSTKCLATVTWDDYASARTRLTEAMRVTHGMCSTAVFVPPPDDTSRSYSHKIRFRGCTS